jgi:hypothetical protein
VRCLAALELRSKRRGSANGRAMNSIPTGRLSLVNPAGTVIAANPITGLKRLLLPNPVSSTSPRVNASAAIRSRG